MSTKQKVVIREKRSAHKARTLAKSQSKSKLSASDRAFEAKQRAFDAIAKMRRDAAPLGSAARDAGTTPATVRKYLPAALKKSKQGKWVAAKSDRYTRTLLLPGPHGPVTVNARGSKEAQLASVYLSSLGRWERSRKSYELAPFHGKKIGGFELITASRTLRALIGAGLLQLDSLYATLQETR